MNLLKKTNGKLVIQKISNKIQNIYKFMWFIRYDGRIKMGEITRILIFKAKAYNIFPYLMRIWRRRDIKILKMQEIQQNHDGWNSRRNTKLCRSMAQVEIELEYCLDFAVFFLLHYLDVGVFIDFIKYLQTIYTRIFDLNFAIVLGKIASNT